MPTKHRLAEKLPPSLTNRCIRSLFTAMVGEIDNSATPFSPATACQSKCYKREDENQSSYCKHLLKVISTRKG
ncbi:hypothetical protein PVL29_017620 [Vitis rotundifolia]|uniref:Uncharacterized protein n=1 Tax=Vitis rotundifolia TaxID=103349 RepID=A0AA38ZB61_VITRO|nr:hypothetical protein PVL29_017620 [Vitis rotundifolia]